MRTGLRKPLGSAASDVLAVLTGKQAVQTQSAVSVDPATQQWVNTILMGGAALIVLLSMSKK